MANNVNAALLIIVMSLVTMALRFLPFTIFKKDKEVPKVISYLGNVLPGAVLGMLVIYCLKDVNLTASPYGLTELLSCLVVAVAQILKRNTIISIIAGTACYMVLLSVI